MEGRPRAQRGKCHPLNNLAQHKGGAYCAALT